MHKVCTKCGQKAHCMYCYGCHVCNADLPVIQKCHKQHFAALALKVFKVDHLRTQKARGILALQQNYSTELYTAPTLAVIQSEADIDALIEQYAATSRIFVRPCPTRPRHGFVESRQMLMTKENLLAIWEETLKEDPNGEMVVMRPINAAYNAIWTPGALTIGTSNDGATSGKECVVFPLDPVIGTKTLPPSLLKAATIYPPDEWPFIETVIPKKAELEYGDTSSMYSRLTQLRAGPVGSSANPDWIPHDVAEVTTILTPNLMDLLEWEKLTLSHKDIPGAVVYHPDGSLCDHYAVHARVLGIPIITTYRPALGSSLSRNTDQEVPYDPAAFLLGVVKGEMMDLNPHTAKDLAALMVLILHHSQVLRGPYTEWLGVGCALMLRLGCTALKGEARHYRTNSGLAGGGSPRISREAVYARVYPHSLKRHRTLIVRLLNLFKYGQWSGSVGGLKWATCAKALIPLFNGIKRIATDPTEEHVHSALLAFNVAMNQAHNNGWWMNKFVSGEAFNLIQEGDLAWTLVPTRVIHQIGSSRPGEVYTQRKLAGYESWKEILPLPPTITTLKVVEDPSIVGALVLAPQIRAIPRARQITIPPGALAKFVGDSFSGQMSLEFTPDGSGYTIHIGKQPIHQGEI